MAPRRAERMSTRGAGYRGNGPAGCSALAGVLPCSWPAAGALAQARARAHSSAYSVSPFGQPLAVQPSCVYGDASLRLGSLDERWQLALIAKNLTNKFVATSAFDQSGTGSASGGATGSPANHFGLFMPPRTVALELTGRF
jgi:outer membrane receptor protein involved in Fe transport